MTCFCKGERIATTSDIGHWFRNDRVTRSAADDRRRGEGTPPYGGQQGVRGKVERADVGIGPYGGGYKGRNGRVVQETGPYEILRFDIFSGENFLRQGDSVISRLFSSGLPSTMGETKEGIA